MNSPTIQTPLPSPNALTAPYWQAAKQGQLKLPRCEDCGQFHFYPRSACPHCRSQKLTWQAVSGKGVVYSYTIVHRAPSKGFESEVPYVVAVVALDEGTHLMTRVIDLAPDAVKVGLRVTVAFQDKAEDIALPMFKPA